MAFVQQNWWLIVIAVVSGAGVLWPTIAKRLSGIPQVGVAEAVNLMNRRDAVVLDVRSQAEFGNGHLPRAKNIPVGELKTRAVELDKWKDKPILVHCAMGNRSHPAAKTLKAAGFTEVFELQGGIGAWTQAGMPTEK